MSLELFEAIDEIQKFAPGVDSNLSLKSLFPVHATAKQKVADLITTPIWDKVKEDTSLCPFLKMAMANLTMYNNLIFYNIGKNAGEGKLYKYQYEDLKELYTNNYHTGMNGLIEGLDSSSIEEWKATQFFKDRDGLIIKNHKDFDRFYQIDGSSYFFSKIVYLLREVQRDDIIPRIKDVAILAEDPSLAEKVMSAIVYGVMAKAIRRFDFNEFPKSLRSYITAEFSTVVPANQQRDILFGDHTEQYRKYLHEIESTIKMKNSPITSVENLNKINAKHYTIS